MTPGTPSRATLTQAPVTADEFLGWLEPSDPERFADLIDGEIFLHAAVSRRHADLLNFLDGALRLYIERHDLGVLHRETYAVRFNDYSVVEPDLLFYRKERADRIRDTYAEGPPDLVVEVLSPKTATHDTSVKFAAYERYGVQECWILDPKTLTHRFYRREGERLVEYAADDKTVESTVVCGFFVRREWLDPDNLPKIAATLDILP